MAAESQFIIPAGPASRTNQSLSATQQPPFDLCVTGIGLSGQFPPNGQILVSDDANVSGVGTKQNAEILSYDSLTVNCNATGKEGFHIVERGPAKAPGTSKQIHASGSRVQLATVLLDGNDTTAGSNDLGVPAAGGAFGAKALLLTTISSTQAMPFVINVDSSANFPASGNISVSHVYKATPNLGPNQPRGTEYFDYDTVGVGANQLRLTARAKQPNHVQYGHPANGFAGPGKAGKSEVNLHFNIRVKSNAKFFPAGNIMICNPPAAAPGSALTNCELMGRTLVQSSKPFVDTHVKTCKLDANPTDCDQIPITERGAEPATNKPGVVSAHAVGSIIVAPDTYLTCRNRNNQPGVDTDLVAPGFQEPATQTPGTSVGIGAVCYTRSQPNPPWTAAEKANLGGQPVIGSTLIVINSIAGQPFLSTGGFCHVVLGPVGTGPSNCPGTPPAPFDTNGPNDGVLNLASACIPDFTPGTNLLVTISLNVDKSFATPDTGTIDVKLDSVTGPGGGADGNPATHDDCDDPSGTDTIVSTVYDTPADAENKDDDTDRDGCLDARELNSSRSAGGLRDPWNTYDYYDINHDGAVSITVDILQVAAAFGVGDPDYAPRKDRGALNYGPFTWNKSAPNGSVDITNDILGVAQQFGDPCPHNHALYTGSAYPAGNAPWYGAGQVPLH